MATYLIVNLVFMTATLAVLIGRKILVWNKSSLMTLIIALSCTAVFDSLIIHYSIVQYDESLTMGWKLGHAPIEDFCYAALAVVLMPSLWKLVKKDTGLHE